LYYDLPISVPVEAGDLVLTDVTGETSDILRFDFATICSRVYIYSDNSDGGDELADTGIPEPWTNVWYVGEAGAEGSWNGITYIPTVVLVAGELQPQPGYMDSEVVTYYFTSDVPEPATLSLLALGGLALLRGRRRFEG
jgi:hypothetical protein